MKSITLIERHYRKPNIISRLFKNVGDFVKRYEKLYEDEDYKIVREFINLSRNCLFIIIVDINTTKRKILIA